MSDLEQMEMMEVEDNAVSEEETKGNLGVVIGLGALGGLAIGAAVNGVIKGVKKLKAKKAEKSEEKEKKEHKLPFWKRKKEEKATEDSADNGETEES